MPIPKIPIAKKQITEKKVPVIIQKEIVGLIPERIIEKAEKKYDIFARRRYEAFNIMLHELQNSSIEVKLKEVNSFFNKVPYAGDMTIWNQQDYWSTPLEFLGKDRGDCEDYVIAKYFALLSLGFKSEQLYFSRVRLTKSKKVHMVLSYYKTPSSIPLILDNTNFKIFPANKRKDLIFIYNLNEKSLCYTREAGHINNLKVFKKWNKLINNIKANKF